MNKRFDLVSSFKVKEIGEEGDDSFITIEGYANTTTKDRMGDIIVEEAWTKGGMQNFMKNPIVLAYHDHRNPIGEVVDYSVNSRGLHVQARISKAAGTVYGLIKDGILKSFSVGFRLKDADYDKESDIFLIKDLELLEISVVSVPANADSVFSLKKNFEDSSEYEDFKKGFVKEEIPEETKDEPKIEVEVKASEEDSKGESEKSSETLENVKEDLLASIKTLLEEKKEMPKEEKATEITTGDNGAEKLLEELQARLENSEKSFNEALDGLRTELKEKNEEIAAIQNSKITFEDNAGKITAKEVDDAVLVSKLLGVNVADTKAGRSIIEKAGAHVTPMTADWEQEFSTRLHNEIRQRLVVAPLFNNIPMNAPTMQIPVNPEAGVGEWIGSASFRSTDGSSTGTAVDHTLTDTTLTAYKLVAKEYIGYEEEEDAIIPIMGIIRDAITRRASRSVDIALLRGTAAGASDPITGLGKIATDAGLVDNTSVTISGEEKTTVAALAGLRRQLGIYGLNTNDLVFVVSTEAYYDLLDDPDFRTTDLVGDRATILTGQIGSVGGSPVIVSGEFEAKASGKFAAMCIYLPNFVTGTLRGLMVERDRKIEDQKNVIVASMRMGFIPLTAAKGVSVLTYGA